MSEPATLWIPGPLPNFNDIINAKLNIFIPPSYVGRKLIASALPNEWAKMKKRWHRIIDDVCTKTEFECPLFGYFNYLIVEANKRRDPDNVGAGAQKIIQDALISRGSLPNDGWKEILGYRHFFDVDAANPGVYLVITQDQCLSDAQAKAFFAAVSFDATVLNSGT